MTDTPKHSAEKPDTPKAAPRVLNPRYAGATPEMVGRALLRRPADEEADAPAVAAE